MNLYSQHNHIHDYRDDESYNYQTQHSDHQQSYHPTSHASHFCNPHDFNTSQSQYQYDSQRDNEQITQSTLDILKNAFFEKFISFQAEKDTLQAQCDYYKSMYSQQKSLANSLISHQLPQSYSFSTQMHQLYDFSSLHPSNSTLYSNTNRRNTPLQQLQSHLLQLSQQVGKILHNYRNQQHKFDSFCLLISYFSTNSSTLSLSELNTAQDLLHNPQLSLHPFLFQHHKLSFLQRINNFAQLCQLSPQFPHLPRSVYLQQGKLSSNEPNPKKRPRNPDFDSEVHKSPSTGLIPDFPHNKPHKTSLHDLNQSVQLNSIYNPVSQPNQPNQSNHNPPTTSFSLPALIPLLQSTLSPEILFTTLYSHSYATTNDLYRANPINPSNSANSAQFQLNHHHSDQSFFNNSNCDRFDIYPPFDPFLLHHPLHEPNLTSPSHNISRPQHPSSKSKNANNDPNIGLSTCLAIVHNIFRLILTHFTSTKHKAPLLFNPTSQQPLPSSLPPLLHPEPTHSAPDHYFTPLLLEFTAFHHFFETTNQSLFSLLQTLSATSPVVASVAFTSLIAVCWDHLKGVPLIAPENQAYPLNNTNNHDIISDESLKSTNKVRATSKTTAKPKDKTNSAKMASTSFSPISTKSTRSPTSISQHSTTSTLSAVSTPSQRPANCSQHSTASPFATHPESIQPRQSDPSISFLNHLDVFDDLDDLFVDNINHYDAPTVHLNHIGQHSKNLGTPTSQNRIDETTTTPHKGLDQTMGVLGSSHDHPSLVTDGENINPNSNNSVESKSASIANKPQQNSDTINDISLDTSSFSMQIEQMDSDAFLMDATTTTSHLHEANSFFDLELDVLSQEFDIFGYTNDPAPSGNVNRSNTHPDRHNQHQHNVSQHLPHQQTNIHAQVMNSDDLDNEIEEIFPNFHQSPPQSHHTSDTHHTKSLPNSYHQEHQQLLVPTSDQFTSSIENALDDDIGTYHPSDSIAIDMHNQHTEVDHRNAFPSTSTTFAPKIPFSVALQHPSMQQSSYQSGGAAGLPPSPSNFAGISKSTDHSDSDLQSQSDLSIRPNSLQPAVSTLLAWFSMTIQHICTTFSLILHNSSQLDLIFSIPLITTQFQVNSLPFYLTDPFHENSTPLDPPDSKQHFPDPASPNKHFPRRNHVDSTLHSTLRFNTTALNISTASLFDSSISTSQFSGPDSFFPEQVSLSATRSTAQNGSKGQHTSQTRSNPNEILTDQSQWFTPSTITSFYNANTFIGQQSNQSLGLHTNSMFLNSPQKLRPKVCSMGMDRDSMAVRTIKPASVSATSPKAITAPVNYPHSSSPPSSSLFNFNSLAPQNMLKICSRIIASLSNHQYTLHHIHSPSPHSLYPVKKHSQTPIAARSQMQTTLTRSLVDSLRNFSPFSIHSPMFPLASFPELQSCGSTIPSSEETATPTTKTTSTRLPFTPLFDPTNSISDSYLTTQLLSLLSSILVALKKRCDHHNDLVMLCNRQSSLHQLDGDSSHNFYTYDHHTSLSQCEMDPFYTRDDDDSFQSTSHAASFPNYHSQSNFPLNLDLFANYTPQPSTDELFFQSNFLKLISSTPCAASPQFNQIQPESASILQLQTNPCLTSTNPGAFQYYTAKQRYSAGLNPFGGI